MSGMFSQLKQMDQVKEPEQKTDKNASLLANQQTSEEEKKQTSKPTSQQTNKPANQQFTKEKRKYGSYLREDSILAIQMLAINSRKKDHEVLQEIVDAYFKKNK